jgi:hypothetical protein
VGPLPLRKKKTSQRPKPTIQLQHCSSRTRCRKKTGGRGCARKSASTASRGRRALKPKPITWTSNLGFRRHGIRRLSRSAAAACPRADPSGRHAVWPRAHRDPPPEAGRGSEGGEEGGLPQPTMPPAIRRDSARGPEFVPFSLRPSTPYQPLCVHCFSISVIGQLLIGPRLASCGWW